MNPRKLKLLNGSVLIMGCALFGHQALAQVAPFITITDNDTTFTQLSVGGANTSLVGPVVGVGTEGPLTFDVQISGLPGLPGTGGNLPSTASVALLEPGTTGNVSDVLNINLTYLPDPNNPGGSIADLEGSFISDTDGGIALVIPPGAATLAETGTPQDVTSLVANRAVGGLKVTVQSDLETTTSAPEAGATLPLLALGCLALAGASRRIALTRAD